MWATWLAVPVVALIECAIMPEIAQGACSIGGAPRPPTGSEWSEEESDTRCIHDGSVPTARSCVAVCQLGFHAVGSATHAVFTCEDDGMMHPIDDHSFVCKEAPAVQCSASPPCEKDGCEWAECKHPGEQQNLCAVRCRVDFYTPREDTVRYECVPASPQGWGWVTQNNADPLVCNPLCSTLPPRGIGQHWRTDSPNNRKLCGDPPYTNQECQVDCDTGFEWANGTDPSCKADTDGDGERVGWYSCERGAWERDTSTECVCTPKVCSATLIGQLVQHATSCPRGHYQAPSGNLTVGQCEVVCEPRYERVAGSGLYKCSIGGTWEPRGGLLECKRTCSSKVPVRFADPHGCTGKGARDLPVAGEQCPGQCMEGYIETAAAVYTCTDSGEWYSESSFRCVPKWDAQVCHSNVPAKNLHFVNCNHTLPGMFTKAIDKPLHFSISQKFSPSRHGSSRSRGWHEHFQQI